MTTEQPERDSEEGLLERLGDLLVPDAEPEAVEASPSETPDEQASEETAEAAPTEDLVDLETDDGEIVRVPQKYKDGYLRQSDYTRKTQEVAALQRQAQATLEQSRLVNQFNETTKQDQERLAQIKGELARYKAMDLTNLDTDQYIKARAYIDSLKEDSAEIERTLNQKAQQVQQEYARKRSEAARNAYEFISSKVKDWKPGSQTESEVASYAANNGIPSETLSELAVMYPGVAVALYKARQYDQLQSTKGAALQKAQKAPPVIRPGAVTSTQNAQVQKVKQARSDLKKTGSTQDLAKVLLARGIV